MGEQNNEVNQSTENQNQTAQPQVVIVQQPATQNSSAKPEAPAKLFSQEELNAIVSSRVNSLNNKVSDLTKQLGEAQASVNQYKAQVEEYQNKESAKALGIADEYLEFAIFNAKKGVTDTKTFADALKEYAEANKQFLHIPEQPAGNNQQNANKGQTNNQPDSQGSQPAPQSVRNLNTNGGQAQNNSVESSVEAFLKARGLKH